MLIIRADNLPTKRFRKRDVARMPWYERGSKKPWPLGYARSINSEGKLVILGCDARYKYMYRPIVVVPLNEEPDPPLWFWQEDVGFANDHRFYEDGITFAP